MLQQAVEPGVSLVSVFKELGVGVGFGFVCMWFYRTDILRREQAMSLLLQECLAVIKENTRIIAEHTSMIKAYMEEEDAE